MSANEKIDIYTESRLGNLVYTEPFEQNPARPDIAVLGLIYELVFLFRRWTSLVKGRSSPALPYPIEGNDKESSVTDDPKLLLSISEQRWYSYWEGASLPVKGKPNYGLVASFVNAVLDKQYEGKDIKDKLRKLIDAHPSIGLSSWTHLKKVES